MKLNTLSLWFNGLKGGKGSPLFEKAADKNT